MSIADDTNLRKSQPYGAETGLEKWAKDRGYRYSPTANCLHWLSKGRCGVSYCEHHSGVYDWMDHTSGWIDLKSGERVLICQPYRFDLGDCLSLRDACAMFNLKASISGLGWYGHGTICIELRVKDDGISEY